MLLYPQLPRPVAEHLARERGLLDREASQAATGVDHPELYYTATGGRRIEQQELIRLRESIVRCATTCGYPADAEEDARAVFDRDASIVLHGAMNISPNEASRPGVWEFITCVLLCDVVRWRFPGGADGTPSERFLAGRRNTFQRLWWRAFVLSDPGVADPYCLIRLLGEDELVQIMERPFLAGTGPLARAVARQLLDVSAGHRSVSRRHLIREAQKYGSSPI
jgi:hypothetical protein